MRHRCPYCHGRVADRRCLIRHVNRNHPDKIEHFTINFLETGKV